jgi:hypothetical protein
VPIAAEQKLKHCADGRIKKVYLLSEPFTRETARALGSFGEVTILDFLPKPLFTLLRKPSLNMRAVLGECVLEIWFEPNELPEAEPLIYHLLEEQVVLPE